MKMRRHASLLLAAAMVVCFVFSAIPAVTVQAFAVNQDSNIADATQNGDTISADGLTADMQKEYEADGSLQERQSFMDGINASNEPYYSTFSVNRTNSVNVSDIVNILPTKNDANMPTENSAKVLVFMVDFPDMPHDSAVTKESTEQSFFGEDSLSSYYYSSSYGKLNVSGDVQDWYTAQHERAYYEKNGISVLYKEVLDYFDAQIDYSQYDADNSGYIDGLYLHFAGDNSGWGSTFWSYVTYIFDRQYDGISVGSRVCLLHTLDVSTIKHETGHLMGLPDYYSYTVKTVLGNYGWVGSDDMMIGGKGDFNAVSKMQLGWISSVKLLSSQGSYSLGEFTESGDAAIVYPFGETEGDSFFVLQYQNDALRMLRVNAKTKLSGEKPYYVHSNMYGETPFIESIADLSSGESASPYSDKYSTHYYNDETGNNTFSGITVSVNEQKNSKTIDFDLKIEVAPSVIDAPSVNTTVGINQLTATIDFSVPFAINSQVVPYLVDENGQRIARMDIKAIFGDSGYYIDKASCVLRVASYLEWGFDGKNEIVVGSDQDYLLAPGAKYTIVIPKGAFKTVMGDIDEMRIDVTADSTADTAKKYQKISTFNRVSEYVTLDDGRVAYAYVDGYDTTRPFRLALISADGSKEEFTLIESDTRGYVGLCQLSDGTLAASVSNKADTAVLFCKFDLTQNKVTARLEQSVRRMQRLYSTDDGFYSIDNSGKNAAKIYFIDNDFTAINEVFAELADEYNYSNYNKFIVGNNVLYISRLVDKLNNSNTERYSNKYSFALYDRDNNKLSECIAPGFDDDRAMFLGADINNKGEIFVAYYDLKQKQLFIMVFDENMNKLRVASPDFPTQSFNSIYTEGIFKCVDDGYFFSYQYIRQYNPKGLVGMFTTETYKQGWLMDSNFNVKSVFDVSYNATAALLGTEGNRFVVGDEYGYYTVNAELTAQEENITLSSDRYVVDNEAQTITGVAEKTTVEELLKFIRSSSENCRYEFVYTHVALDEPISQSQELSCNYQLIVYNSDGSIGKVYTFPQLPQDFESTFKITSGGWLYNYTATDEVLVVPDFVKNISDDANDFSVVKSLTTSARVCLKGGIIGNSKGLPRLETVCLDGAQAIGYYGFSYCHNLKKVVIPDTVTKLEQGAFSCCSELEEITIPASVVEIAPYALSSLSDPNLKITYLGSREQWEQIDFGGYNWEDNYGSRMVFAGSGVYETAPAFRFSAASLTLQDNLQINYKVKKELFEKWGYVKPYVEFIFGADIFYVSDYVVSGDYYVFNFSDIAPNKLNDTIYATLYATKRGTLYSSETKEYSVATYCYNMLSQYNTEQYASFRTLLVDLLNYGASSQQYTGYKSGILANASLTEEQAGWGTIGTIELNSVMNKAYEVIDSPSVIWSGAGLNLKDSVTMRFKISAESLDGLYVKVKSESGEWKINSKYFEETDGGYYVYFSALNAGQMSESVYLTAYKGDVAVSNTICYSIESYAYSKQNDADSKLVKLLNDMMKYGRSANVYSKQGG